MRIQRYILKSKNKITAVSFLLILSGLILKYLSSYQLSSEILLIIASIIGIAPIAIQAYQAIRVKVVSIDLLVTIAVIGAFFINNFEESSIVTFLFLFGSFLEERTLSKTRKAVKELIEMAPEIANKKTTDGSFVEVSVDDVTIGDILLVKTGDKIPVDGIVLNGGGYANQAAITGESISC